MPTWLRSLTQLIRQPIDRLRMDARSVLTIDSLGHLLRFDSSVRVDPFHDVICVRGTVEGRQLQLKVRSGETSFTSEAFLPSDALLSDALSPQTRLPGLREGQTWTMPVYSPFWSSKNPLEIVHATVESLEPIIWNGDPENCWLVVYRSDPGSGGISQDPRGRLWVRRDGAVLRQQVFLFDSIIRFDRLPDDKAVELAEEAGPQWWNGEDELQDELRWDDDTTATPTTFPLPTANEKWHERGILSTEPAMEIEDDLWDISDD